MRIGGNPVSVDQVSAFGFSQATFRRQLAVANVAFRNIAFLYLLDGFSDFGHLCRYFGYLGINGVDPALMLKMHLRHFSQDFGF